MIHKCPDHTFEIWGSIFNSGWNGHLSTSTWRDGIESTNLAWSGSECFSATELNIFKVVLRASNETFWQHITDRTSHLESDLLWRKVFEWDYDCFLNGSECNDIICHSILDVEVSVGTFFLKICVSFLGVTEAIKWICNWAIITAIFFTEIVLLAWFSAPEAAVYHLGFGKKNCWRDQK